MFSVSAFYSDLGSKEKERKQKRLMKDQDKDGDNKVTLEEFETWVLEEVPKHGHPSQHAFARVPEFQTILAGFVTNLFHADPGIARQE